MTFHSFIELLKYKRSAKGRHGTHSPFVYDLVEHVLMDKGPIDKAYLVECPDIPLKYENLLCRIAAYYGYKKVVRAGDTVNGEADLLLVDGVKPGAWMDGFSEWVGGLSETGAVIVTRIHESAEHEKIWKMLCSDERVRMSVDVYGFGMLLFRKEFKERQHFVLKC